MEKEFVPYEQALALKELGFDKPCMGYYSNREFIYGSHTNNEMQRFRYSAPTYSQAFRWFREKYGIMHRITSYAFGYQIHLDNTPNKAIKYIDRRYDSEVDYGTYEEAELACLTKLIEIVEGIES